MLARSFVVLLTLVSGCHAVLPLGAPAEPGAEDAGSVDRVAVDRQRADHRPDHLPTVWIDLKVVEPADQQVKPADLQVKPDLKPPDLKPPDLKPLDLKVKPTCTQRYKASAPGFTLCEETPNKCKFHVGPGKSCETICQSGGGACIKACADKPLDKCACDYAHPAVSCSTPNVTGHICFCSRP